MSKISSMMDVGKRSLQNSQTALQTVSHNIANKSTEGYSRQRVDLQTAPPVGIGDLRIGMGARASQISRTNNPWLEKQLQKEQTQLGFHNGRTDALNRVEQVYNEQMNKGLNQYMTQFFNSYRELGNNPESLASRTMVREGAQQLADDFRRVNSQLKSIQEDIDGQLTNLTDQVNRITKEIASLNEKITQVEVQGIPANDERDRRDLLLKQLGEKVEISWAEGKDGQVAVTAGSTAILVSGSSSTELLSKKTDGRDLVQIHYREDEHGSMYNLTEQFKGGQLGGLLEVRDVIIEEALANVDELAYNMAKEVNRIHIEGHDRYGQPGVLFFEMPDQSAGASAALALNKTIFNDVGRIAAGNKPNAPGDNTIANMMSSLQYRQIMSNGTATFDDFYTARVGELGTITQRARSSQESQKNILDQLGTIRESISGVSLDEETTKMIEMQKLYDASARVIRTADEMLDTVLNLKRL
ncbi:MAG: flagellar hook-associated protein FlgK [Bdellovibrionales bacterium]